MDDNERGLPKNIRMVSGVIFPSSQQQQQRYLLLFILFLIPIAVVIIFLVILTIITSFLFFYLNQNHHILIFNNNNNIILPKDQKLYDLQTHTFRSHDHSLYRYKSKLLILNEASSSIKTSSNTIIFEKDNNNNQFTKVISTVLHDDDSSKEKLLCQGTCNCYLEDDENDRKSLNVMNLVYSHKFTSVVVVSVFGFAISKFVDDHLDTCYEQFKSSLGYYDNIDGDLYNDGIMERGKKSKKKGVNIDFEKQKYVCDFIDDLGCMQVEDENFDNYEERYWSCNGYCITNKFEKYPEVTSKCRHYNCESKFHGFRTVKFDPKEDKLKYGIWAPTEIDIVKGKYIELFLRPFCWSFSFSHVYEKFTNQGMRTQKRKVRACVAVNAESKTRDRKYYNVECTRNENVPPQSEIKDFTKDYPDEYPQED